MKVPKPIKEALAILAMEPAELMELVEMHPNFPFYLYDGCMWLVDSPDAPPHIRTAYKLWKTHNMGLTLHAFFDKIFADANTLDPKER